MSTPPQASRVLATRFSSCALSEIRAVTAIASPPVARIAAATSSHGSWLRAEMTTRAPASAKASAIARPMPREEPVTIATLPERSNRFISELPSTTLFVIPGLDPGIHGFPFVDGRVKPGHDEFGTGERYIPS